MRPFILALWLFLSFSWDALVFGITTYLVFWQGHSGWWYLLATFLCLQTTVIKTAYEYITGNKAK